MLTRVYNSPNEVFNFRSTTPINVLICDFIIHSVEWGYISIDIHNSDYPSFMTSSKPNPTTAKYSNNYISLLQI